MIEVKIDLVPFGDYEHVRQIGYIKIWNDGTGDVETGNYKYEICDDFYNIIKSGEYKNFKRAKGVYILLKEILNDAL
jgi:hypothetical protein